MDIKSPEERSRNMSRIRSRDTKPEVWLRKQLFARGYRYRKNVNYIPGHPDLWLAKYHTAIFVHGCFWHRHEGCKYAYMPKSRIEFWEQKFEKNILRDEIVKQALVERNIKCLIVWECSIKEIWNKEEKTQILIETVERFFKHGEKYLEL